MKNLGIVIASCVFSISVWASVCFHGDVAEFHPSLGWRSNYGQVKVNERSAEIRWIRTPGNGRFERAFEWGFGSLGTSGVSRIRLSDRILGEVFRGNAEVNADGSFEYIDIDNHGFYLRFYQSALGEGERDLFLDLDRKKLTTGERYIARSHLELCGDHRKCCRF